MCGVLVAAAEPWPKFRDDPRLRDLFLEYGEEFEVTPDPDWALAHRLWMAHDLHAFALREDNALVGFCLCLIHPILDRRGSFLALADKVYVKPAYRGDGTKLLLDCAMQFMRDAGAAYFALHHAPKLGKLAPLGDAWSMRVWTKAL